MSPPADSAETSTNASTSSLPPGDDYQLVSTPQTWEEPHPGQRLPLPSTTTPGQEPGVRDCTTTGICRADMAAKASGQPHRLHPRGRSWFNRRQTRSRLRNTSTSNAAPVKASAGAALSAPSNNNTSIPTDDSTVVYSPMATGLGLLLPGPCSFAVHEANLKPTTDATARTSEETITPDKAATAALYAPLLPSCSDFSQHLDAALADVPDDDVISRNSTAFSLASTDVDAYGWEAELERKSTLGASVSSLSDEASSTHNGGAEKPQGGKRSLFHRVFGTSEPLPTDAVPAHQALYAHNMFMMVENRRL